MCWARHICAGTETTQGSDEAPQASNETGLSATKPFRKLIQVSVQTRKTRLPYGSLVFYVRRDASAPQPPRCPTRLPFVPHPPFLQRPLRAPRICTVRARIRRPSAPAAHRASVPSIRTRRAQPEPAAHTSPAPSILRAPHPPSLVPPFTRRTVLAPTRPRVCSLSAPTASPHPYPLVSQPKF